jgi:hypothetical protein
MCEGYVTIPHRVLRLAFLNLYPAELQLLVYCWLNVRTSPITDVGLVIPRGSLYFDEDVFFETGGNYNECCLESLTKLSSFGFVSFSFSCRGIVVAITDFEQFSAHESPKE